MSGSSVVDLEPGGQRPLSEVVRMVTEEGVVVAEQSVVNAGVGVAQQQFLVLVYYLEPGTQSVTS